MLQLIKGKIQSYSARHIETPKAVCAGVIVPVFENDEGAFIILTKRTHTVSVHKGEVSFPGGMCEDDDGSTMITALRECCEEIGVRQDDVEVIGRLDDMITLTGFVITPYVGIIPYPYDFRPNPKEVAYLLYLPISYLMQVEASIEQAEHEGSLHAIQSFYYRGDRIWGATCRMLLQFKRIIGDGKI